MSDIMDSWTNQPGFPILNVSRDNSDGSVSLYQTRFLFDIENNATRYDAFEIAFTYRASSLFKYIFWFQVARANNCFCYINFLVNK